MRTRMSGGVGAGRAILPATRFDDSGVIPVNDIDVPEYVRKAFKKAALFEKRVHLRMQNAQALSIRILGGGLPAEILKQVQ